MNIQFDNKILTINNHSVALPFFITNTLAIKNQVIVLMDDKETLPLDSRLLDTNVYAFDDQASELWRIQQCPHGGEQPKPYMLMKKNKKEELIVSNYIGVDYLVNLENGEVEAYGEGKRPW